MCIFGSNPEKTNHCQLITVTIGTRAREHEEAEIAELDFRQHCAVACVNGKFDRNIFQKSNIDKKKLKEQCFPFSLSFCLCEPSRESRSNPRNKLFFHAF